MCDALCCCFSAEPPTEVKAKGRKGEQYNILIGLQDKPNTFQTNMCNAPCADPCCFCLTCGFPCCMSFYWRKAALEQYGNGMEDYVCCQGYVGKCCCCDFPNMGRGSTFCACCEACCFDTLMQSFSRIYVMEKKDLRPDPVDYQIIAFSNCMQCLACICHTLAIIDDAFDTLACIIDLTAEIVERTVSGCMGAQIHLEIEHSKNGGGAPAEAVADAEKLETAENEKLSIEKLSVIIRDQIIHATRMNARLDYSTRHRDLADNQVMELQRALSKSRLVNLLDRLHDLVINPAARHSYRDRDREEENEAYDMDAFNNPNRGYRSASAG